MRLVLHQLRSVHPKLRGHPIDLAKLGGLALQRAGHASPATAGVIHDGVQAVADIEWLLEDLRVLEVLDSKKVTEHGAEAVALTYVNAKAGWVVKRCLQQGEYADWLMENGTGSMAVEVSGTAAGNPQTRLEEKKLEIARCSIPVARLAVVVAFERPSIMAGSI